MTTACQPPGSAGIRRTRTAFALATALTVAVSASAQESSADRLLGGFAGIAHLRGVPRPAVPAVGAEITRDDILKRFAECAAWMIDTVFPILDGEGGASRSVTRGAFWACAYEDGWPYQVLDGFIGNPVDIAESVLSGGDSDVNAMVNIAGLALLDGVDVLAHAQRTNCYNYENLWVALYGAMTPAARHGLTEPDAARICGR